MAGLNETRLGVFGGTFDPPHIGHLILAEEACHQLGIEQLLWVLTPDPPHKLDRRITPLPHRLDMLEAALEDNPGFEISRVDINRPAPHFAVDTVRILKEQNPHARLFYLMGGDSLRDLPSWRQPQEFVAVCDGIGVMSRPGYPLDLPALEASLPGISTKIQFVETPLLEISASRIRRKATSGGPYRYYLHPAVYNLIQKRGIYQSL